MPYKGKRFSTPNLDEAEGAFFERDLETVEAEIEKIDYPEYKARTLIPVDGNYNAGTESIVYYVSDRIGTAKIVANNGSDYPRVDVFLKEYKSTVKSGGDSYGYTYQDIRAAQMANRSLDSMKAEAAQAAYRKLEDDIAWDGDEEYGLQGFLDFDIIPEVTLLADGDGASKTWASKTADQILRDLHALDDAPWINTKEIEKPDTMLLPLDQYRLVNSLRIPDTDITVAEFFLKTSNVKSIVPLSRLKGLDDGKDVAIVYTRDPRKVKMALVMEYMTHNPIEEVGEFVVAGEGRTGGIIWKKAYSAAYASSV
jgi:hypothetical protein